MAVFHHRGGCISSSGSKEGKHEYNFLLRALCNALSSMEESIKKENNGVLKM